MEFSAQQIAAVTLIRVSGRIDHKTVKDFETALTPYLDTGHPSADTAMILDLAGLDFLTSAGLRMLMIAAKACQAQNRAIGVADLQPVVQEIFAISRFDLVLKVFPTVQSAVATLSPEALPAFERS